MISPPPHQTECSSIHKRNPQGISVAAISSSLIKNNYFLLCRDKLRQQEESPEAIQSQHNEKQSEVFSKFYPAVLSFKAEKKSKIIIQYSTNQLTTLAVPIFNRDERNTDLKSNWQNFGYSCFQ